MATIRLESGGTGFFHPDPGRLLFDRNPSRSQSRQNIRSGFLVPIPPSTNRTPPALNPSKVFPRDSIVPIPSRRGSARDFDPDLSGIGTVPPDSRLGLYETKKNLKGFMLVLNCRSIRMYFSKNRIRYFQSEILTNRR